VRRTPYAQLPVYRRWRGGGTLEEVIVKKIEGDRKRLAEELREVLGCDPAHVKINPTTTHIEVKVRRDSFQD
jgi:large subunit ribosomal protein L49